MANGAASTKDFRPAFKRIVQMHDMDCGLFACLAMVTNKTLFEVRKVAEEKFEVPKHGPWWLTPLTFTNLCNELGWGATAYKKATSISELPDIAFLMVDYNAKTEIGRNVLFHRQRAAGGVEYWIDPAEFITDPSKQIRTDVKNLAAPLWYIGVHQFPTK